MALLLKTPILNNFSESNDLRKLDEYIESNITEKGILLIRRYYGITAIK